MHSFPNYQSLSSMGGQLCVKKQQHDWSKTAGINNDKIPHVV